MLCGGGRVKDVDESSNSDAKERRTPFSPAYGTSARIGDDVGIADRKSRWIPSCILPEQPDGKTLHEARADALPSLHVQELLQVVVSSGDHQRVIGLQRNVRVGRRVDRVGYRVMARDDRHLVGAV